MPAPLNSGHPVQIGIIVRSIEEALPRYEKLFGEREWLIVENGPSNMHGLHIRGVPAAYSMRLALAGESPQIELIQPLGEPSIIDEWLERRGEGLHHLGYLVDSVDETIAAMEQRGYACIQHGYGFNADGSGAFAYFDTESELGYLLEALEPGTG
jgi:catechol 2,3-dioxygenase-like lactoylglutathione lyase family enzyme